MTRRRCSAPSFFTAASTSARRELVAELRVRRAADPERMPRAVDVVLEARLGQLLGLDRAAEPVVALEDADAPVGPREEGRAGKGVDAAPDDDRVVVSHFGRSSPIYTRVSGN